MEGDRPFRLVADAEPDGFVWHESYTKALAMLPTKELQTEFVFGVIAYGSCGTEPFFDYPLNVAFEAVRPNIDANRKRIKAGKKGGRPPKEAG